MPIKNLTSMSGVPKSAIQESLGRLAVPDISQWRPGNTGTEGVWHFDSGAPGRHVLITAIIHGNELCGAWALKDLLEAELRPNRGSLTLAFCNLAAFDQFNPDAVDASRFVEKDMNRVWSDAVLARGASVESRRAAVLEPFVRRADWLLDIHSMHERSAPLLLTGMQARNLALAKQLKAPEHIVVDAGHAEGVRMRDFADFGAPDDLRTRSLLAECGLHTDPASHGVARDVVFRFLRESQTVDPTHLESACGAWKQPDAQAQWVLEVTQAVVAVSDRFRFERHFSGLEMIAEAGSVIGWNDDLPVSTPYPDCVLVMPSRRQAAKGVTVVRFAKRRSL
jgi:predicted deacylase